MDNYLIQEDTVKLEITVPESSEDESPKKSLYITCRYVCEGNIFVATSLISADIDSETDENLPLLPQKGDDESNEDYSKRVNSLRDEFITNYLVPRIESDIEKRKASKNIASGGSSDQKIESSDVEFLFEIE